MGFRFQAPPTPPVIGAFAPDSAAQRAGLEVGDRILAMREKPVADFADLAAISAASQPGEVVLVHYKRGEVENSVRVTLGTNEAGGRKQGFLGIGPARGAAAYPADMMVHSDLGPVSSLNRALVQAWEMTALQARLVWRMLTGHVSFKNLSGPLSIAEFAGESASDGVAPFFSFLVLISLSLGFLNLLPIPILDGGQIVFQIVEWLKGSPLSERAQMVGQQVGLALLVLLMGVALFNDIVRQFN